MAMTRPDQDLSKAVHELVTTTSMAAAARSLRFSEATIARIAAGLPITEGTAALARQRLSEGNTPSSAPAPAEAKVATR